MGLLSEEILKELVTDKFKTLPRIIQTDAFLIALSKSGYDRISPKDISQIFKDANMRSPDTQKKIRCGAFKVKELFELMSSKQTNEELNVYVTRIDDDQYEISLKA